MDDYENNRELIEQTVRVHGLRKAYDMLRGRRGNTAGSTRGKGGYYHETQIDKIGA